MTIFINSLLRIFLFVVYRLPNMCATLLWYEEFVTFFDIERIIPVVNSDVHSPSISRVNAALPMIDNWYDAFNIKEGDKHW